MLNTSKLIEIIDPQAGVERVTEFVERPSAPAGIPGMGHHVPLREAATTSEFPQVMKDGLRAILFETYAGMPNTHELWCDVMNSNKPDEVWIEGNTLGLLPQVGQNVPYPEAELALDRSVQITNAKRGAIVAVTREMILFDQTNLIRQQTQDLARAMRMTEENDAYTIISTAGNFTRTTADNDVGNNTAATQFGAAGLITALTTLRTMKDQKSGRYLGVSPNLLICTPNVEFAAKQLLFSPDVMRSHGNTSAEVYGTGMSNPFRGVVTAILVSPWLGSNSEWVLMESKKAVVKQVVWDLELVQESPNTGTYLERDVTRYKASKMYGVGMLNDRFAYYSSDSTGPTVG